MGRAHVQRSVANVVRCAHAAFADTVPGEASGEGTTTTGVTEPNAREIRGLLKNDWAMYKGPQAPGPAAPV